MKHEDLNLALWGHDVTLLLLCVHFFRGVCHVSAHARAGTGRGWVPVARLQAGTLQPFRVMRKGLLPPV